LILLHWLDCGFSYDEFWRRTPRETDLIFKGYEFNRLRQHNDAVALAWHVAGLSRSRKLPSLKSLIVQKPYRAQSWQDHLAIMKALTEANTRRKKK
jgi:hypothetical protein